MQFYGGKVTTALTGNEIYLTSSFLFFKFQALFYQSTRCSYLLTAANWIKTNNLFYIEECHFPVAKYYYLSADSFLLTSGNLWVFFYCL